MAHGSIRVAKLWDRGLGIALLGLLLSPSSAIAAKLSLAWDASAGPSVQGYVVYYGVSPGNYSSSVDVGNATTYTITGLTSLTTYYLTVKAYSTTGEFSAPSNEVSGVPTNGFTDELLISGVTVVRAVHLAELRSRIDALRSSLALPAMTWTDPSIGSGSVQIKSVHLTEMRTALGAIYAALARTPPTYTNTVLTGIPIRAIHLTELRAAVVAVE
jgi:hypothetical protein